MRASSVTRTGDFTTGRQLFKLSAFAVVIGALCAVVAVILLKSIAFVTNLAFYHRFSLGTVQPTYHVWGYFAVLIPAIGGLIIGLIARYGTEKVRGHGIPEAIEAMLIHESKVQPRVAFWKPISAAVSIGTGGPYGAEGPIIMTGGAVGSLIAQMVRFSAIERRILLVAGAAGGMSATFAAPIASVMFTAELLVFELKPRSLVPIALASAIADAIRSAWLGTGPLFPMPALNTVPLHLILGAAGMGVVGCALAILLTHAIYKTEDTFKMFKLHWMWWPAIGGLVVGIGGLFSPRALGVGYTSIADLLRGHLALSVVLTLLLVKAVIWVISLGSGTSGGILAPILIIGGSFGATAGSLMHVPHPGMWALLGMSAIFAGVTRTPFTSVIFPLELTHNIGALLPLLITSCIATGLSAYFLPRSILTEKIARRGLHLTREYNTDPLQMHLVRAIAKSARLTASVEDLMQRIHSRRLKSLPEEDCILTDEKGEWMGILPQHAWSILQNMQDITAEKLNDLSVRDIAVVSAEQTVKAALQQMIAQGTEWAFVEANGTLTGFFHMRDMVQIRILELKHESERAKVLHVLPVDSRLLKRRRRPSLPADSSTEVLKV